MNYEEMIRGNEKIMNVFNYYTSRYYYTSYLKNFMDLDDYRQEQEIALYKRFVSYYDEKKYKLSSFVIMSIKSTNATLYRKANLEKNKLNSNTFRYSLDFEENEDDCDVCTLEEIISNGEDNNSISFLIDSLGIDLTEEEKKIVYLTYLRYSTREIDKILNLKEQSTKYKLRKIRKKLKNLTNM